MKRYNTYKDSGERFAGEVPANWQRYRIKYLLSRSSAGVWGDDEKGNNNDIICFRIADFDYAHGVLKYDNLTLRNIEKSQRYGRMLSNGDLLIEKSGGGDATPVGRVVRFSFDEQAVCSNFIHSITVRDDYSNNFLYYYFYSLYANKENLLFFNQTTGIQNLKVGEYLGQSIFLPPLAEQVMIADWLDVKCEEIDKLIATQQQRIELLQELRQSIITRAVTHGINPDVTMKPSDIDWIGDIPKHWDVRRIKTVAKTNSGSTPKSIAGKDNEDSNIIWVRTTDLSGRVVFDSSEYISNEEYSSASCPWLPINTVLIAMYGGAGTIGKCGILGVEATINQALCSLNGFSMISQHYLFNCVKSMRPYWMKFAASSRKDPNISQEIIKNAFIPIPPLAEQQDIVGYIERETAKIDATIGKAERQIALLQELRQSVISEVVTGKRKVC